MSGMGLYGGWLAGLLALPSPPSSPAAFLAILAIVAAGLVATVAARHAAAGPPGRSSSLVHVGGLRDRARRLPRIRLSDPAAPGRPRPRAPSANLNAA